LNGAVGRRAKRTEDQENLIALDQLARLLDRFWRIERIIVRNEGDLAAIDTALGVDLAEIGRLGPTDDTVGRCRPAVPSRTLNSSIVEMASAPYISHSPPGL
jgi:hypothetical protein